MCCSTVFENTLRMSVTSRRAISDSLLDTLERHSLYVLEAVHMEIHDFYNGNKHNNVCQNLLHDIKSMCILKFA